ncbi:MAG: polyprenyl synthetase family protein [Candidatus Hodarchaeaceae archaeon]|nr:polyprenyl synthetase family protein [Candidatus Hodarchaeaceae archaeon]
MDRYTALIDRKLEGHFRSLKEVASKYHHFMLETYENLEEYVLRRGKRLASCSTLLAYKGYAGDVDEKILNVGVGIELYRHSILVHDDLVDEDEARRGGKSFHELSSGVRGPKFGGGVAIFLGDAAYALSLEAILNSGFSGEALLRVVRLLAGGYREVNESQVLDLLFEHKEPDVEEWYAMASKRAASLFKATILTGAILGGAPEEDLRTLGEAAVNIGYAFDIQDDIIDTFATEQQYGRPPGGDVARGKKPLHVVYALKLAGPDELEVFKGIIGKGRLTSEDLETVREILRRTGALRAAKAKSVEHAEEAKELIGRTRMDGGSKEFFSAFTDYIARSLDWYK